jgi:hypothetical protein
LEHRLQDVMTRPMWLLVVMLGAAVRGELVPELPYDDSGETPVVRLEFGKKVKLEGLGASCAGLVLAFGWLQWGACP